MAQRRLRRRLESRNVRAIEDRFDFGGVSIKPVLESRRRHIAEVGVRARADLLEKLVGSLEPGCDRIRIPVAYCIVDESARCTGPSSRRRFAKRPISMHSL